MIKLIQKCSTLSCAYQSENTYLWLLDYFGNLNRELKSDTYPMNKIIGVMLTLSYFKYDISLDLNMKYYHIYIGEESIKMCTIIFSWVKY